MLAHHDGKATRFGVAAIILYVGVFFSAFIISNFQTLVNGQAKKKRKKVSVYALPQMNHQMATYQRKEGCQL